MALFNRNKPLIPAVSPDLFRNLPRGVPGLSLQESEPPHAQWMDAAQVQARFAYQPEAGNALLLGASGSSVIGVADDRHILTVAGSRAGKGVSAIIPNLIFYRGSVLVIDPKGENANITALSRARRLGQKVYVLDPFEITAPQVKQYRAQFNPLSILTPNSSTLVADAGMIADALVITGSEAHWDDTARDFIEGVILHVVTWPDYEGRRDFVTVRQLINEGVTIRGKGVELKGMAGLYWQMSQNDAAEGVPHAQAAAMEDRPDTERGSVLSSVRRHTKFLDLKNLQAVLSGHNFDLTDLKTGNITVYLCLPASRLGLCSRWFRLFVNLTLEAMERSRQKPSIPVLVILDEFPVLGHMRQIEDAAGQIAGFGVRLWPIIQDLTQLQALYKQRWETFMGNAGILQFFGNNDVTTLEWIAKRLGRSSLLYRTPGEVDTRALRQGQTGEKLSHELVDLITPDEAARVFGRNDPQRRQLVMLPDLPPMILQRFLYHQDSLFHGKYH